MIHTSHQPVDYDCPFCRIIQTAGEASDVIFQTNLATAFLSLARWPANPVDVLVVPNRHYENLYNLPDDLALPLHKLTRAAALALKDVYTCDGVSTRQHNEPAGNQDVWHYHIHVTPRFTGDDFYRSARIAFPEAERLEQARILREHLRAHAGE